VVVLVGLFGVLIAVGLAVAWQARQRLTESAAIYGVEDALDFVWEALSESTRADLTRSDVRRILEWELNYLQQPRLRGPSQPAVVGGMDAAAYVQDRTVESGYSYEPEVIFEVLDRQADYLAAIGAVGAPAEAGADDQETT
jgi:hypothetical protein